MKNFPRFLLVLLILAPGLTSLRAVGDDRQASVMVRIEGSATGQNFTLVTDAVDANPLTLATLTSYGTANIAETLRQKPGVSHSLTIQPDAANDGGSFAVSIQAPPGYTVYIDSNADGYPDKPLPQLSGTFVLGVGSQSSFNYQVVEDSVMTPAMAGKLTRLDVDDLVFELSLGTLKNGKSAGRLQLRNDGMNGANPGLSSDVFSSGSLVLVGAYASGLTTASWQYLSPGLRLETGQVRVDLIHDGATKYTASFYAGNDAGGYNGTAFAAFTLEKITSGLPANAPSNSDCLKITEAQGSVTVTRYVFRSTTGDTWYLFEGTSTEQRIEEHVNATVSGNREETVTTKNSTPTAVAKRRLTWTPYSVTELLTKVEIWTDAAAGSPGLTTTYEYYTGGGDGAGDKGKLKKITHPNGGTTEYNYYDDTDRLGQVYTVKEPWSSGSATSDKITTYDYTGPSGAPKEYVSSEETVIGTTTVAKTTHSYDFTATSTDSFALAVRTSTHYAAASSTLTSITATYQKGVDYFFAGKPYFIKTPDGRQQSFRYFKGSYSGGSFTEGSGNASRTLIVEGSHLGGSATTSIDSQIFASIGLIEKKSTYTEIIRDGEDNVVSEKTKVWDGSAWDSTLIVNTTMTWTDGVRQTGRTEINGAQQDWTWNGSYLASSKDAAGVELTYGYDSVGRLSTVTRTSLGANDGFQSFDALTTTYGYNAANLRTSVTEAGGSLTRTTSYTYDAAGRPTGFTLPDGRTGGSAYSFPGSNITQVVETLPGGATRTSQTLVDGKVKQITGTDYVAEYYGYTVESTGWITTRLDYASSSSARWQKTVTDRLGRITETRHPGYTGQSDVVVGSTYDSSTGLLTKLTRTGLADEYRSYDYMGFLTRAGLDLGANSSLAISDAGDRVTDFETIFHKDGSNLWWVRSTEKTYPSTSSPSTELVTGRNWARLTGLGSGTLAETRVEDRFGNQNTTITTVDRTKRRLTQTTTYPGVTNNAVTVSNNGFPSKMTGTDLRSVTQTFDSLGRLYQQQDSRHANPTTYGYVAYSGNATNQVYTVTDPTSAVVATYDYDTAGRIEWVKNVNNVYAYYGYDGANRLRYQWGGAVTPVEYTYTSYGERNELKTYRGGTWTGSTWPGGTADTTTHTYDGPSGLLTSKQDSAGNHTDYTYNSRMLVDTRDWSRTYGGNRVRTTFSYVTNSTELSGKTYNDGTANVSFTYNRLGQLATAVDVSDGTTTQTRTFEYDSYMRLTTEKLPSFLGSRWISYTFESGSGGTVLGRASGYKLGTSSDDDQDLTSLLGYSGTTGNVGTLAVAHAGVASRTFTYSYKSNTSLLGGLSESTTGYSQTRNYEANRDLLTEFTTLFGSTTKTRYDYTYNSLGQKESAKQYGQTDSAFADLGNDTFYRYVYNSRGELTQAAGYLGTSVTTLTAPLPGRLFDFGYDQAGNRTSANSTGVSGLQNDYTPNGRNQIASRENNFVPVSGTVNSAAKVVVDGSLAGQQGNYWSGEAVLNNTSGPAYTSSLSVKAAKASPHEKEIPSLLSAFIPAASESFTYDLDGNVTDDGQWDYTWDAENRLVKMETDSAAMGVGLPGKRLVFRYDSLGRRTAKEVWAYSGSSWSKTSEVRFVYQGWNLVAELDTTSSLMRSYAWGLDLGGSLSGMGGIGALVQIADHTGTVASYLPGYDGMGNVAAMMKSDGAISATYEYGPFGDLLRRKGTYAGTNPFRSATKYTDDESGLVFYGRRYYSPSLGRFLGRDPIGEAGGLNLYGFVGNNPGNGWDYLGMDANVTTSGGTNTNGDYVSYTVYNDGPTGQDLIDAFALGANRIATTAQVPTNANGQMMTYTSFGTSSYDNIRAATQRTINQVDAAAAELYAALDSAQAMLDGYTGGSASEQTKAVTFDDYLRSGRNWHAPGTTSSSLLIDANRPAQTITTNPNYDPGKWNDGGSRGDGKTVQGNSNCYAYACNQMGPFRNGWNPPGQKMDVGFGMQPGDKSGNPISGRKDISINSIRDRAIADGLSPTPVPGGYPVVLVIAPGLDYHWYRQDADGAWSHKPGSDPVTNLDASRNRITDVSTANTGIYTQNGGTLWVPPDFKF